MSTALADNSGREILAVGCIGSFRGLRGAYILDFPLEIGKQLTLGKKLPFYLCNKSDFETRRFTRIDGRKEKGNYGS